MNKDNNIFMKHIVALAEPTTMLIYPTYEAQIASLTGKKIGIFAKYFDFFNIFSLNSTEEQLEYNRINNHPINILDNKQLPYSPIYCLDLVGLETLKTYLKANLAIGFIRLSKSPASTLIPFVQKKNGSLCLCIDY